MLDNTAASRACFTNTTGTLQLGMITPSASPSCGTCDATVRGTFCYVPGTTGVKDIANVCAKDGADAYAWRTIY